MNDEKWMEEALKEAEHAFQEGEVPIGAIIVKDGIIISAAHNKCVAQNDPSLHAECLALKDAYRKLNSLSGCTMYVTVEPCAMCAGSILQYRLPRLVYGAYQPVTGCCGSKIDLLDHWFDSYAQSVGGILEDKCANLLNQFFSQIRTEQSVKINQ